eukprot:Sspe_Gene.38221::Locus_18423_Transcript_1_1_Confidence_1.000_Length_714::g.38221::m.38221
MASAGAVVADARHFVVMANGSADFRTISDALREAADGDTITVKIGQYDEKVVIDRSVHIQGDSTAEVSDVIINGGVVCRAGGSLKNLTVINQIEIRSGDVVIEGCDISEGFDGIRIMADANPTITRNTIHHARQGGDCIYFAEGSRGTVEDNEIHNARVNGIQVNAAEAVIRRNRIHHCSYGVFFRRGGKGTVDGNTIQECATLGVYIIQASDPVVERN